MHMLYSPHLDPDRIVAPPIQYAFEGNNAILNCTTDFPGAVFSWFRGEAVNNNAEVSGVISNITIGDEGTYTCRVFLPEAGLTRTNRVQLRVISKCTSGTCILDVCCDRMLFTTVGLGLHPVRLMPVCLTFCQILN